MGKLLVFGSIIFLFWFCAKDMFVVQYVFKYEDCFRKCSKLVSYSPNVKSRADFRICVDVCGHMASDLKPGQCLAPHRVQE